jgi:hypothetical protein
LLDADLPLQLQLSQVDQHGPFLRGESIGFALQPTQTIFGPLRRGRRAIPIRRAGGLGEKDRQAHDHQAGQDRPVHGRGPPPGATHR